MEERHQEDDPIEKQNPSVTTALHDFYFFPLLAYHKASFSHLGIPTLVSFTIVVCSLDLH